jgi:hypothetical protein
VKPPRETTWIGVERPTDKQLEYLEKKYGIDASKSSKGEAGRLISQLRGRITQGQMKVLTRAGYTPGEISNLAIDRASRLIEKVKENGWRRPSVDLLAGVV